MRELVFIAELNAMESQLGRPLTPIEPGCRVGITLAAEPGWFGDPEAAAASPAAPPAMAGRPAVSGQDRGVGAARP